ncbi:sensor histidine kinase [Nocardioides sp. SYSU D00038]|uniref:sensor histidine kinase n=1 Tax=Nocardioides sp. SYSU D00038 TaxID=2812554 RepID=UPI0019681E49|nr:histidine kinase [Nocardioides sp. SYSU D00038]
MTTADAAAPPLPRTWQLGPRGQRRLDRGLVALLLLPVPGYLALADPAATVALVVIQVVPLLWRRRHPAGVFAVVALGSAVQLPLLDRPLHSQIAYLVAVYSLSRFGSVRATVVACAVSVTAAVAASVDWLLGFGAEQVTRSAFQPYFLTITTLVVTAVALGTLGRTRQAYVDALVERGERIAHEAAQQVELAASQERARIAREMHDVVAHGLSVIVVQADGARYAAAADPDAATRTLATIADTGRASLTEMRRLLGLLRSGDVTGTRPQPRLDDLAVVVEESRAAGTEVRATLPPPGAVVPDGVALTAYRVVQEALSNVRKHAGPGATATVEVVVGAGAVRVTVDDDGRGAAAADDGRGLGLVGMRERVAVHDGELVAGPRPGGGFRVSARIPL